VRVGKNMVKTKKKQNKNRVMVTIAPKKNKKIEKKEVTLLGGLLRGLGGVGGRMVGNMVGFGDTGAGIGTGLGASLSRWLGSGDYRVSSNSLISRFKGSGSIPNMHKNGQSITVRHKEYITDIIGGTGSPSAFAVFNTYALNPGLETSFPWLSGIANQFQEYTWKGVVFEYVSTSGQSVASTNTALGTVMMATQYRATAPPFTNKQVMLNEFFSSDSKPSEDFCHPIECNPRENPYNVQYVRGGAVPAGEDQKTYDIGVLTIATEGLPSSAIDCGELWVSYEVELRKPISNFQEETFGNFAHYVSNAGITNLTPFGTAGSAGASEDNIGLTKTSTLITFPLGTIGRYMINYACAGVTAFNPAGFFGSLTNCAVVMNENNTPSHFVGSTYTVGTGAAMASIIINIPDNTLVASVGGPATTLTGGTWVDLWISQVGLSGE